MPKSAPSDRIWCPPDRFCREKIVPPRPDGARSPERCPLPIDNPGSAYALQSGSLMSKFLVKAGIVFTGLMFFTVLLGSHLDREFPLEAVRNFFVYCVHLLPLYLFHSERSQFVSWSFPRRIRKVQNNTNPSEFLVDLWLWGCSEFTSSSSFSSIR